MPAPPPIQSHLDIAPDTATLRRALALFWLPVLIEKPITSGLYIRMMSVGISKMNETRNTNIINPIDKNNNYLSQARVIFMQ